MQKISPAGVLVGTFGTGGPSGDRGVAATADGDIWVANSGGSSVSRLRNNGSVVTQIGVGQEPTGVAVDGAGKVWSANLSASTASRIDPATNAVDLTVSLGAGAGPYNYSDMTGSTLTGAPDEGTWSVVYDSEAAGTEWALVDWNGTTARRCRADRDGRRLGRRHVVRPGGRGRRGRGDRRSRRRAGTCASPSASRAAPTAATPELFDLMVAHAADHPSTLAYKWRLVEQSGPPIFLSSTTTARPSFVAPDDGVYVFELTVTDAAGRTDTDEVTVRVANRDPGLSIDAGAAFAGAVTLVNASLTDEGWLDTHSARFDWGDGTVQDVPVTAQGTGWGTFFGSHVYRSAGSFDVTVTLTDDDGGTATKTAAQLRVSAPVALWANSQTRTTTLDWGGGTGAVEGRIHSNNELLIRGKAKRTTGPITYAGTFAIRRGSTPSARRPRRWRRSRSP